MSLYRFAILRFAAVIGVLASTFTAEAQTLPLKGPGLGNLTYTNAELFREISTIRWNTPTNQNGMPAIQYTIPGRSSPQKPYGNNVGIMLNGYFLTSFAPDSGEATGGFLLYDVSNPRAIRLVKTIYEPNGRTAEFREPHAFGVTKINGRDYVAIPSIRGVEFWDFTDINNIQQVKKLVLPGINAGDYEDVNWQMWWQAPYLYVASASRGMFIVDARDPANAVLANRGGGRPNPIPIGSLGGFRLGPIFAMGNQLLLSSMETSAGFATLDISDPLNPVVMATRSTLPFYYATCFNGKKLYSTGRNGNGLVAGFDLTNPRSITAENQNTPAEEGLYCATQDNFLILGAQRYIFKYNVSNGSSYPEVGRSERVPDNATVPPRGNRDPDLGQVAMFGNLVFVGGDHGTNTAFRPHQTAPDTTRPTVIASSPTNGATQQAATTRIGLGFSDSILPDTLNTTNFIVRPVGGSTIAGTYSVQLGMVNFSPASPLQPNTQYEVVLTANGVKDYAGNGIAQQYRSTFTTSGSSGTGGVNMANRWPLTRSLVDLVGSNDGTATSADLYREGGLDFTSRTTGVQLESNSIAESLAGNATVSFRIKTSQTGNDSQWLAPGIFGRDQDGGTDDVFWGWIDAGGFINLSVGNESTSNPGTRSGVRINDNRWHEVAMTRDSGTGAQAVYVDGAKVTSSSQAGVLGLSDKLQMLGNFQGQAGPFRGILSDVRVYRKVLNDTEVRGIFQPAVLPQRNVGAASTFNPASLGMSGVRYLWNMGDGSALKETTSASPNLTYTYATPGNYTVTVTAIAANGVETLYSFTQAVINPVTATAPVHTSNIVGNANTVYSVDPDDGTLAAITKSSNTKAWEVAVGKEPKTVAIAPNGQIWVAVQGDDKFVRVDPSTRAVTNFPLDYGSAPYGIAFTPDGTKGLLTLSGRSSLVVFNPTSGAITNRVTLPTGDIRGIAVTGNSSAAYVTRFRSKMTQGELYRVNLTNLAAAATTIALPVDTTTIATEAAAPGVANYVNQAVISPDGLRVVLPSKKDNIVQGRFRRSIDLKADTTVRSVLSQVNVSSGQAVSGEQIDFNNRAPARATVFAPSGNYIFVAQMESNSVEVIDPYQRAVIGSIAGVGRAPHGLYLDAPNQRLYVNNFLDRKVTVHDIRDVLSGIDFVTPNPTSVSTVASEPLTATVLNGKKVFYNAADPRMSGESYMSCASCHVDGDSDGMVWDFTQRGEGLRRTISLQGKAGLGSSSGKLHWTANFDELQDFENDIRTQFEGAGFLTAAQYQQTSNALGTRKTGMSADLDNLAAYITSLNTFPRSPSKSTAGCLTLAAQAGKTAFEQKNCARCHGTPTVQDNLRHDVGTIQTSSGRGSNVALAGVGFDTPSLYGVWQQSAFLHNGQAANLGAAMQTTAHVGNLTATEVSNLTAYIQQLDSTAVCNGTQ